MNEKTLEIIGIAVSSGFAVTIVNAVGSILKNRLTKREGDEKDNNNVRDGIIDEMKKQVSKLTLEDEKKDALLESERRGNTELRIENFKLKSQLEANGIIPKL